MRQRQARIHARMQPGFVSQGRSIVVRGQGVTGSTLGRATDATDAVVPGTAVEVRSTATPFYQTVQTDAEGRYLLSILPPGACDVTCTATGFQAQVKQGVVLMVAAQMALNVEIPVGNALR